MKQLAVSLTPFGCNPPSAILFLFHIMKSLGNTLFLLVYLLASVPLCFFLHENLLPLLPGNPSGINAALSGELADIEAYSRLLDPYGTGIDRVLSKNIFPAIYAENLPQHLSDIAAGDKASLFISLVLPNVLRVNEEIRTTRRQLLALVTKKDTFRSLTAKERWWLNRLARTYGCDPGDTEELRLRVDTVPVALALAQAITESGWGTSRFAQVGNSLYGQHLADDSSKPHILSRSGKVKMAAFSSLYEATRSYIHTLNRVRAYAGLRAQRAELRAEGHRPGGLDLAGQLGWYSEIGARYVSDLQYLITHYGLEHFNRVRLGKRKGEHIVRFAR